MHGIFLLLLPALPANELPNFPSISPPPSSLLFPYKRNRNSGRGKVFHRPSSYSSTTFHLLFPSPKGVEEEVSLFSFRARNRFFFPLPCFLPPLPPLSLIPFLCYFLGKRKPLTPLTQRPPPEPHFPKKRVVGRSIEFGRNAGVRCSFCTVGMESLFPSLAIRYANAVPLGPGEEGRGNLN